ncbi:helicase associated domain-containing protein [Streptomyces sp. NPDC056255]|uniref:helicase associated domain-containing protein n=1 Tax=Streptomyces sp. NPDC056255 TaxID=3345764 RepID=UPI0035D98434
MVPVWDTGWQRCYCLVQNHDQAGSPLPTVDGDVIVQGEDLGRGGNAQQSGWEQLLPVQQWLLENTLKDTPAGEEERPGMRTQDTKWARNLTAARQFHAREGHLRYLGSAPSTWKSANALSGCQKGADEPMVVRLGTWLDSVGKRAAKLPEQRRTDLDELGMGW